MLTCLFENNHQASLRHVTVNALVLKNNQILLGKRGSLNGKPISESGKWGLLGGFMDRDETLTQAIRREVKEESGWEIDQIQLFRLNDNPNRPKEDRQNVDIIFLAQAIKQLGTGDEEVAQLEWFNLNQLPPIEQMAFDHGQNIQLYQQYLVKRTPLPILG